MSMKKFGEQLRQLLAGIDKDASITPTELLAKASKFSEGNISAGDVLAAALKKPRFCNKIIRAVRRSPSGRVILYARKRQPMVITIEQLNALHTTLKSAQVGLRKYWAERKTASV